MDIVQSPTLASDLLKCNSDPGRLFPVFLRKAIRQIFINLGVHSKDVLSWEVRYASEKVPLKKIIAKALQNPIIILIVIPGGVALFSVREKDSRVVILGSG